MAVRIAVIVLGAILLVVCAIDILGGGYVNQVGVVEGHNTYITTECVAEDTDGDCTAYMPETHYQLIISHGNEVTVAEVYLFTYYRYQNGDRVQVAFWRGRLVGIKWFVSVGDVKQDW